ncbi:MAG: hypothetical protein ACJAZA_000225 [Shewanella psychromarinicola]|jgi:hypothetical protein|tara:strand:+ start:29674 stop:29850 length:177 start_codon:yes stop_codon:yes gene_type:complete
MDRLFNGMTLMSLLLYTNRQGNENREKDCRKHDYMDGAGSKLSAGLLTKAFNGHNLIT